MITDCQEIHIGL